MKFSMLSYVILLPLFICADNDEPDASGIIERIRDMRNQVEYHDNLYFRENRQEISDAEYDSLKRELVQLESTNPEQAEQAGNPLDVFGDDRKDGFEKKPHLAPMLSLNKCYTVEDLERFHDNLSGRLKATDLQFRLEPKIDGVAISAVYENGILKHVLSRGDGDTGNDLTSQVRATGCLPEQLRDEEHDVPAWVELRGEAYVPIPVFRELNRLNEISDREPFASPRNLAAGTLQLKDTSKIPDRGLKSVIFSFGAWLPELDVPATENAARSTMKKWGLPVIEHTVVARGKTELLSMLDKLTSQRGTWDYPADGIVIELENIHQRKRVGTGTNGPDWATAFKFPSPVATSVLMEIIWQTGVTGRVTPVALFEPVVLDGRTIERASLYSDNYLKEHDFRIGDAISVELKGHAVPVIRRIQRLK